MSEAIAAVSLELTVNGREVRCEVEPRTLLVDLIRRHLGLTGTHIGCETSYCGACTILVDGEAVKSCTVLAVQVEGCEVRTVEGLAGDELHPLQEAFSEHHGLQCGYCTPGLLMSSLKLLSSNADPTEGEIRKAIAGNVCRCTGYQNVIKAIQAAAHEMRGS